MIQKLLQNPKILGIGLIMSAMILASGGAYFYNNLAGYSVEVTPDTSGEIYLNTAQCVDDQGIVETKTVSADETVVLEGNGMSEIENGLRICFDQSGTLYDSPVLDVPEESGNALTLGTNYDSSEVNVNVGEVNTFP